MKVGVPSEVKSDEYRVALTPVGARELAEHGHEVLIQRGRGGGQRDRRLRLRGPGCPHRARRRGCLGRGRPGAQGQGAAGGGGPSGAAEATLFTYLHLAPAPELTRGLRDSGATCVAYETVEDQAGRLPLLAPMSEIAGKIATQAGAFMLEKPLGGRGILLGGVPGVAPGERDGHRRGGRGDERRLHRDRDGGRRVRLRHVDRSPARAGHRVRRARLDCLLLHAGDRGAPAHGDLVIGAVLLHGARAPHVIKRSQLKLMQRHAVLVDVAIDQGGCFETSKPTTHHDPTFEVEGVIHYCVTNMPGAVPITSTYALTNATLPYVLALADHGVAEAARRDPGLKLGINVAHGKVTHPAVAEGVGMDYVPAGGSARHRTRLRDDGGPGADGAGAAGGREPQARVDPGAGRPTGAALVRSAALSLCPGARGSRPSGAGRAGSAGPRCGPRRPSRRPRGGCRRRRGRARRPGSSTGRAAARGA